MAIVEEKRHFFCPLPIIATDTFPAVFFDALPITATDTPPVVFFDALAFDRTIIIFEIETIAICDEAN